MRNVCNAFRSFRCCGLFIFSFYDGNKLYCWVVCSFVKTMWEIKRVEFDIKINSGCVNVSSFMSLFGTCKFDKIVLDRLQLILVDINRIFNRKKIRLMSNLFLLFLKFFQEKFDLYTKQSNGRSQLIKRLRWKNSHRVMWLWIILITNELFFSSQRWIYIFYIIYPFQDVCDTFQKTLFF